MNPEELITAKEREKIQIFIKGKDYAVQHKFQSYLVVKQSTKNSSLDKEILKTKAYKEDTSPNYQEDCIIDYYFEKTQYLSFTLFVNNAWFGTIKGVLLNNVFKNKTGELNFKNQKDEVVGKLLLHSNIVSVKDEDKIFEGSIRLKTPAIKANEKYIYKIFRWDYHLSKKQDVCLEVYRSDPVSASSSQEAEWPSFAIKQNRLCLNNESQKLTIEFFKYSPFNLHSSIGKYQFALNEIKRGNEYGVFQSDRKVGTVSWTMVKRKQDECFLNYVKNGLQINSVIFIDFTQSNKPPTNPNSNHYVGSPKETKYQEIITNTIDHIMEYDEDKKVPVFGFGCSVNHSNIRTGLRLSPLFPISMDVNNPELNSLEEIKKVYRACMQYLKFSGPTYFSPIIKWAAEAAKQYLKNTDHHEYMILFILTDGQLCDQQKSIDLIVECSSLPVSIVIIGIGNQDFSTMREFDRCQLVDSKGNRTLRDLVKFVEYEKFKEDPEKLRKQVLEEIPLHVQSYFALKK